MKRSLFLVFILLSSYANATNSDDCESSLEVINNEIFKFETIINSNMKAHNPFDKNIPIRSQVLEKALHLYTEDGLIMNPGNYDNSFSDFDIDYKLLVGTNKVFSSLEDYYLTFFVYAKANNIQIKDKDIEKYISNKGRSKKSPLFKYIKLKKEQPELENDALEILSNKVKTSYKLKDNDVSSISKIEAPKLQETDHETDRNYLYRNLNRLEANFKKMSMEEYVERNKWISIGVEFFKKNKRLISKEDLINNKSIDQKDWSRFVKIMFLDNGGENKKETPVKFQSMHDLHLQIIYQLVKEDIPIDYTSISRQSLNESYTDYYKYLIAFISKQNKYAMEKINKIIDAHHLKHSMDKKRLGSKKVQLEKFSTQSLDQQIDDIRYISGNDLKLRNLLIDESIKWYEEKGKLITFRNIENTFNTNTELGQAIRPETKIYGDTPFSGLYDLQIRTIKKLHENGTEIHYDQLTPYIEKQDSHPDYDILRAIILGGEEVRSKVFKKLDTLEEKQIQLSNQYQFNPSINKDVEFIQSNMILKNDPKHDLLRDKILKDNVEVLITDEYNKFKPHKRLKIEFLSPQKGTEEDYKRALESNISESIFLNRLDYVIQSILKLAKDGGDINDYSFDYGQRIKLNEALFKKEHKYQLAQFNLLKLISEEEEEQTKYILDLLLKAYEAKGLKF